MSTLLCHVYKVMLVKMHHYWVSIGLITRTSPLTAITFCQVSPNPVAVPKPILLHSKRRPQRTFSKNCFEQNICFWERKCQSALVMAFDLTFMQEPSFVKICSGYVFLCWFDMEWPYCDWIWFILTDLEEFLKRAEKELENTFNTSCAFTKIYQVLMKHNGDMRAKVEQMRANARHLCTSGKPNPMTPKSKNISCIVFMPSIHYYWQHINECRILFHSA